MTKRKLGLLIGASALICVGLALSAVWSKYLSPLTPRQFFGVMRSNEIRNVITAARDAAKRSPTTTMIIVNGTDHEFHLPNGATSFGDKYLICMDEFAPYLERLPSYGYVFEEQMGSMYQYRNEALGILVHILRQQYPGNMCLFNFVIVGGQQ